MEIVCSEVLKHADRAEGKEARGQRQLTSKRTAWCLAGGRRTAIGGGGGFGTVDDAGKMRRAAVRGEAHVARLHRLRAAALRNSR